MRTLVQVGNFVRGRLVPPASVEGSVVVRSPADQNDVVCEQAFGLGAVDDAIDAARKAASRWRSVALPERIACLRRYAARLDAHASLIAHTIAREVGKPSWEAQAEVRAMIAKVDLSVDAMQRYTADHTLPDASGEVRYRPHGVVAVVGPFNMPGHLPNGQIVPALLHGNTVVFKPSDRTPTTGVWIAMCLAEAGLPAGVLNLVHGDGRVGQALTEHRDVDGILFTGSVATGKAIVSANVHRLDRIIALELGGKNAALALDDCDIERTARAVVFGAFASSGQRCSATSRLMVHRRIAPRLISRVVQLTQSLRVGYPLDPDVFMGPVISEAARQQILERQRAALDTGFEPLVSGGAAQVPGRAGWYLQPAIHQSPGLNVVAPRYEREELFGPDLAVYVFDDDTDAIRLANDTPYGLTAAVFTAHRARFEALAEVLEVGVVHWNRPTAGASSKLPFGGIKHSGNHRPGGILMGSACAFPQARLLEEPAGASLASWPGTGWG
jgi:succinylglutamic semialdehyde dehydrogenase